MLKQIKQSASHLRTAFTLIELLVVMGVITLVAAVTLPSIKGLMKGQTITQGVRLVKAYAESAKARAIGSGRPVALIIERMKLDNSSSTDATSNDTSTRLSIGEVFPPYSGDWAGSTAIITQDASPNIQIASIPSAQAASLLDPLSGLSTGLVLPDDVIQFGDNPQTYRIVSAATRSGNDVQIKFANPPFVPLTTIPTGEATLFPNAQQGAPFPSLPMKFRIFRKPSKSLVGSITLPRGICIDLSVSGLGPRGRQFGAESISGTMPAPAGYYGTVFIVFNSMGNVQDLYYATTPNNVDLHTVRHAAGSMIHLLVGKTDQVFPNPVGDSVNEGYLSMASIPSPTAGTRDDLTYNILDSSNYWVSINPFTGAVYSSQVAQLTSATNGLPVSVRADARTAEARALASAGIQSANP